MVPTQAPAKREGQADLTSYLYQKGHPAPSLHRHSQLHQPAPSLTHVQGMVWKLTDQICLARYVFQAG